MRIGSLFSGIGGLELGLERATGGHVVWQVERDAYCRHILARHWPDAARHDDVRTVGAANLALVDLLCGGFPCQDVSAAGKQAGLGTPDAPTRSGLWYEMRRIIGELRPTWVVVENVAHTWRTYVPLVRRDLWGLGYASVPIRVRACDVGARHERARIFVVAGSVADVDRLAGAAGSAQLADVADHRSRREGATARRVGAESGPVAHNARERLAIGEHVDCDAGEQREAFTGGADGCVSPGFGLAPRSWMVRGVHGLPSWVDGARRSGWTPARIRAARIRALGNAVVPQCAEVVGRLIAAAMEDR
jgi:DNA (cytosine-5)-methyltransferase 1